MQIRVRDGDCPDARWRGATSSSNTFTTYVPRRGSTNRGFVGSVVEPADWTTTSPVLAGTAIDRRPAAVAHATDADDVAAAIGAAQDRGLAFTIRAGGHSVSGRSVRDGALCIDLRALNDVDVDPSSSVVRVGGGALLGELDAATKCRLAVPADQISPPASAGSAGRRRLGWPCVIRGDDRLAPVPMSSWPTGGSCAPPTNRLFPGAPGRRETSASSD
jgi:hypothetical protein